jgi:hypothetical protein
MKPREILNLVANNKMSALAMQGIGCAYCAGKYQAEMIQFMNRLHVTATKYHEQLATVSFTQERIDEINAIKRELDNADQQQENLKKNRANITQERLTKLNACWNEISEIARLGKLIFANDFGKYQRYVIYPNGQQGIPTPPPAAPQANQEQAQGKPHCCIRPNPPPSRRLSQNQTNLSFPPACPQAIEVWNAYWQAGVFLAGIHAQN